MFRELPNLLARSAAFAALLLIASAPVAAGNAPADKAASEAKARDYFSNVELVDQDGRSMFPEGSKYPYELTRRLLAKMAPVIARMPNRIQVTGHTTSGGIALNPSYTNWELSADRANAARQILTEYGVPSDRFYGVVGKADSEPLFPNDPYLAANRRIGILLMREEPPIPLGHNP